MFEILGEEFNLFYTLVLVGLVLAAYFYLFRTPSSPPPRPLTIRPVAQSPTARTSGPNPPRQRPPETIPPDTVRTFLCVIVSVIDCEMV